MKSSIKKPLAKGLVTTTDSLNFKSKLKKVVVQLACYGFIPIALADWLLQSGGLTHE